MKLYILCNFSSIHPTVFSSPLDATGLENADNIVEDLEKIDINQIICSPFLKCMQTIYPFCIKNIRKINLEFSFHGTCNPLDNIYSFHHFGYSYVEKIVNIRYQSKLLSSNMHKNENSNDIRHRIFPFLYNLYNRYKMSKERILIITHQNIQEYILKFFNTFPKCKTSITQPFIEINIKEN